MHRIFERLLFLIAVLIVGLPVSQAVAQLPEKPFLVETGIIEMHKKVVNPAVTVETTETMYFKEWGKTIARYTTTTTKSKFIAKEEVKHAFSLQEGPWLTTVDLDEKTGIRIKNTLAEAVGNLGREQRQKLGADLAGATGTEVKEVGEAEVAGRRCAVKEAVTSIGGMTQTTRMCMWMNIPLRIESGGMGTEIREEAVSVQTDVPLPGEKFRIPDGIQMR